MHSADNHGGRISFRYVVPFTCLLIIIFGILYGRDKNAGGYRIERLTGGDLDQVQRDAKVSV